MIHRLLVIFVVCFALSCGIARAGVSAFYTGGPGGDRWLDAAELSDGSVLLAGYTDSLDWIPASAKRVTLDASKIEGQPGGSRIGLLLHLSSDLKTVQTVVHFPPGAVEGIRRIRTTEVPGMKTGSIVIAAWTNASKDSRTGYALAKLDGNFVDAAPSKLEWTRNIWAENSIRDYAPFDVTSEGKVYYASGKDFAADWVGLYRLKADGSDDVVKHWRYHEGKSSDGSPAGGHWTPADNKPGVTPERSAVVFKFGRPDLRSWTQAEYDAVIPDGNGKTKQGTWPNDYYFSGPASPDGASAGGPGYTGYRTGKNPTARVVAITVDRRNGDLYFGYCVQSKLPDGLPDFEPAVVKMNADGQLQWWSRLYEENNTNSTPDQYVDGLAFDYANDRLVVLARCHGNNNTNLWPGKGTFQKGFTGSNGNIHIGWLGLFKPATGDFINSTYVAEYGDGNGKMGKPFTEGLLKGWPDPNGGWPDVNTTRMADVRVDAKGNVLVVGSGRRPFTTADAFVQNVKPGAGSSAWADFARVYASDLSTIRYSTILSAPWDPKTGAGASEANFNAIVPLRSGGFIAVGEHGAMTQKRLDDMAAEAKKKKREFNASEQPAPGTPLGQPIPTKDVPAWGTPTPANESGIILRVTP